MSEPKSLEPKMGFETQPGQPQPGLGDFLWDAHAAASRVLEFTAGRSPQDYAKHEALRAAIQTLLGIMLAALEDVQTFSPETAEKIPHAHAALAMRDPLAADDAVAIWLFIQGALAALVGEIAVVLEAWHSA